MRAPSASGAHRHQQWESLGQQRARRGVVPLRGKADHQQSSAWPRTTVWELDIACPTQSSSSKVKKRKDYTSWRQFDDKPSVIPSCRGAMLYIEGVQAAASALPFALQDDDCSMFTDD